jgi:hypothetical protein
MSEDFSQQGVPVAWITSVLNGENQITFCKLESKADRILAMTMLGHTDIKEPWGRIPFWYLG